MEFLFVLTGPCIYWCWLKVALVACGLLKWSDKCSVSVQSAVLSLWVQLCFGIIWWFCISSLVIYMVWVVAVQRPVLWPCEAFGLSESVMFTCTVSHSLFYFLTSTSDPSAFAPHILLFVVSLHPTRRPVRPGQTRSGPVLQLLPAFKWSVRRSFRTQSRPEKIYWGSSLKNF